MEKENRQTGKSSLTPLLIIAAVAVVVVLGIFLIVRSGDKENAVEDTNSGAVTNNADTGPTPLANWTSAPPGAVPPHFKGSESAAVIVEEFADFQCPQCAVVHPRMNEINARFGNKIRFVFRNYPLTTLHPNAYDAAVASEAAALQGRFWEMQNQLFMNQTQWSSATDARRLFAGYAEKIGLDVERFGNDILAMNTKLRVDSDMRRGRALNITGTPTILVNGRPVATYEVSDISAAIEKELAKFSPKKEDEPGPEDSPADAK